MEDILLKGNSVRDSLNEGIVIKGAISNVSVIDNEITGNGSHGIAAFATTKIDLDNVGIENGLLKDNQIYNNGGIGVYLDATLNFTLENILEIELFNDVFETGDFGFVFDEVSTDYALYEIRNSAVTNGSDDDFDLILFTDTFDFIAAPYLAGSDEQIPVLFKPGSYVVAVEAFQVGTIADPFSSFTVFKTTADVVADGSGRPHSIEMSGNAIYGNVGLGIDLSNNNVDGSPDGVTQNMENEERPNGLQNFPVLSKAKFKHGELKVKGGLNSKPETSYRIELFANTTVDASGNGEGQFPLGTYVVTTNAAGYANINMKITTKDTCAGDYITATATRLRENMIGLTSEFSAAIQLDSDDSSHSCSRRDDNSHDSDRL
jgi:hypothetical protein